MNIYERFEILIKLMIVILCFCCSCNITDLTPTSPQDPIASVFVKIFNRGSPATFSFSQLIINEDSIKYYNNGMGPIENWEKDIIADDFNKLAKILISSKLINLHVYDTSDPGMFGKVTEINIMSIHDTNIIKYPNVPPDDILNTFMLFCDSLKAKYKL